MFKAPRGTQDILPVEQKYWQYVYAAAHKISAEFHYQFIETPIFETTSLFQRGVGDHTDIVQKEMYTFEDHGGDQLTLRPEGTASICRAYLENGMKNQPQPVRLFYLAPMFRYERPQAGRLRQHHQFGAEVIGDQHPEIDAEIIEFAWRFLNQLGLSSLTLKINSLSDSEDREQFTNKLFNYYSKYESELPKIDRARLQRAPMRLLDSKETKTRRISENAPRSIDFMGPKAKEHWQALIGLLDGLSEIDTNFSYKVDNTLVRGLDYYNRTVFEFEPGIEESQTTLLAGGRYDPLMELLGGDSTPGIGFGSGIERIILELKTQNIPLEQIPELRVVIISSGTKVRHKALNIAYSLRSAGISTLVAPDRSFKAQMRYANQQGSIYAVIVGEREMVNCQVALKPLKTDHPQTTISVDSIIERVSK